jgi:hypothetical protein
MAAAPARAAIVARNNAIGFTRYGVVALGGSEVEVTFLAP